MTEILEAYIDINEIEPKQALVDAVQQLELYDMEYVTSFARQ
jgi:hypothetical protein